MQNLYKLNFEMDYKTPIEQLKHEMQRETQNKDIDNTRTPPKTIFKTFH